MAKLTDNVYLFGKNARFGCMTNHPGFQAVCLNPFVLSVAWLQYKQVYDNAYEGPQHKKYRHIAYRQYVRWVHGHVGRNINLLEYYKIEKLSQWFCGPNRLKYWMSCQ